MAGHSLDINISDNLAPDLFVGNKDLLVFWSLELALVHKLDGYLEFPEHAHRVPTLSASGAFFFLTGATALFIQDCISEDLSRCTNF